MPMLYCEKDGEKYLQSFVGRTKESFEGEAVLVTKGRVIVEGCRCDKCNVPIKYNDTGYLISFWLADMEEDFPEYGFGYEHDYLEFKKSDVRLFGWDPELLANISSKYFY